MGGAISKIFGIFFLVVVCKLFLGDRFLVEVFIPKSTAVIRVSFPSNFVNSFHFLTIFGNFSFFGSLWLVGGFSSRKFFNFFFSGKVISSIFLFCWGVLLISS